MAQFILPDIPGAANRGLQFAQQQKLNPLQVDAAELAIQQQKQNLQFGQEDQTQSSQFNKSKQQQLDQSIQFRTDEMKNIRFVNSALKLKSLPDEQKLQYLLKDKADLLKEDPNADTADTDLAIELAQAEKFKELDAGADNVITQGERQGIIKTQVKNTASQQDFETFKELTATANKTNDPADIQLAEQFGRQSGFDRETPQELADIDVDKESKKTLVKQAATASKEAFDSLKGVRTTIANIDDAIKALDNGASTGPIVSKLPSFRQAAIELNNIKGRMGLDVVGATTFGALSESELAFALNVALPDSLKPKALKDWLTRKKDTQTKMANELRKAASFLGTPGNTIAMYLEKQDKDTAKKESKEADIFAKYGL